jgi:phage terminase small subunit
MKKVLNSRQRKFVNVYTGNATEAARLAGYSGNANTLHVTGHDLLRNPTIKAAIDAREKTMLEPIIATRHNRQMFWTSVMNDKTVDLNVRLKASELLGKSQADFTLKIDASVNVSLAERMKEARKRMEEFGKSKQVNSSLA